MLVNPRHMRATLQNEKVNYPGLIGTKIPLMIGWVFMVPML